MAWPLPSNQGLNHSHVILQHFKAPERPERPERPEPLKDVQVTWLSKSSVKAPRSFVQDSKAQFLPKPWLITSSFTRTI